MDALINDGVLSIVSSAPVAGSLQNSPKGPLNTRDQREYISSSAINVTLVSPNLIAFIGCVGFFRTFSLPIVVMERMTKLQRQKLMVHQD